MNCNSCNQSYNPFQRIPKIYTCGHSVCSICSRTSPTKCLLCKQQSSKPNINYTLEEILEMYPSYYLNVINSTNTNPVPCITNKSELVSIIENQLQKTLEQNGWASDDVFFSDEVEDLLFTKMIEKKDMLVGCFDDVVDQGLCLGLKTKSIIALVLLLEYGTKLPIFKGKMKTSLALRDRGSVVDFDINDKKHQQLMNQVIDNGHTGVIKSYGLDSIVIEFIQNLHQRWNIDSLLRQCIYPPRWKVTEYYGKESIVFLPSIVISQIDNRFTKVINNVTCGLKSVRTTPFTITFNLMNPCFTLTSKQIAAVIDSLGKEKYRNMNESVYSFLHQKCLSLENCDTRYLLKTILTPGFNSTEAIIDYCFNEAVDQFLKANNCRLTLERREHVVTLFVDKYQFLYKEELVDDFITALNKYSIIGDRHTIKFN